MKKLLLALILALFAVTGVALAAAPTATSYWRSGFYYTGDHGIAQNPSVAAAGAGQNTKTILTSVTVTCKPDLVLGVRPTTPCVFAIRNYFTVATGSVLPGQMYAVPVSATVTIPIGVVATVGAYHDDLTGATSYTYKLQK
jgi:hypothetical protein